MTENCSRKDIRRAEKMQAKSKADAVHEATVNVRFTEQNSNQERSWQHE